MSQQFEAVYNCQQSPTNRGNQITMPQSALRTLMTDFESLSLDTNQPMLFSITNLDHNQTHNPKISHCGVNSFTAEEGSVLVPPSLANTLHLQDNNLVQIKNTILQKGTYVKLQPHTTEFLTSFAPDLKEALEESLVHSFFCVTTGDTLEIIRRGRDQEGGEQKSFLVDVVETKPGKAVSLVDTDCEVDFDTPLDYKEPEPEPEKPKEEEKKVKVKVVVTKREGDGKRKFVPFSGGSRRLSSNGDDHQRGVDEPEGKRVKVGCDGDDGGKVVRKFAAFSGVSRRLVDDEEEEGGDSGVKRQGMMEGRGNNKVVKGVVEEGKKEMVKEPIKPFTGRKYTLLGD